MLRDSGPSAYLSGVQEDAAFREYPFSMLLRLKETEQSAKYHPEGNVWNHTMLVIDAAARVRNESSDTGVFMWAALLHDIGKPGTTKKRRGKITAYGHDTLGADLSRQFLNEFGCEGGFIDSVVSLVRWHMQILYVNKSLPFADIPAMKREANIADVALLCLCDRLGRAGANRKEEEKAARIFLETVEKSCSK